MVVIRKASRYDAPVAWEIRKAAIGWQSSGFYSETELKVWTAGELTEDFSDIVERYFHVIELDGEIVATGMIRLDSGKIDALFVKPAHMAKGFGRMMLKHLESIAVDAGLDHMELDSTLNAVAFYRKSGFVGEEVSVYHSPRGVSLACVPMGKRIGTET